MMGLIDLGNTRFKWMAAQDLGQRLPQARVYAQTHPAVAAAAQIMATQAGGSWRIASVRDATFNARFCESLKSLGAEAVEFATIPARPEFPLAYADPSRLGIDRYLCLLAAYRAFGAPVIVISAGTAVTIDALGNGPVHLGGVIFPGVSLMRRSLAAQTDRIEIGAISNQPLYGQSTSECVGGGTYWAFVGGVRDILQRMRRDLGQTTPAIVTGGDAGLLHAALPQQLKLDAWLLFRGLAALAKKTQIQQRR